MRLLVILIALWDCRGSSTAAEFLHKFIEDEVAWAHLDIAGKFIVSIEQQQMWNKSS